MKKSVIFLILLVIAMPLSFANNEKIYIYGGDGLVASKEGDDITYYNQDFLGSNKIVSDEDGNIINKNVQYPFGEDYSKEGSKEGLDNNYKFTGQEQDEDLYYYGARYYDPSISRFISVDPMYSSDISPYAYVGNNPLKYVDPNGKAQLNSQQRTLFQTILSTPMPMLNTITGGLGRGTKALANYLLETGEPMEFKLPKEYWNELLKHQRYGERKPTDTWKSDMWYWYPSENPEFPANKGWYSMQFRASGPAFDAGLSESEMEDIHNVFGTTTVYKLETEEEIKYIISEIFDFSGGIAEDSTGYLREVPKSVGDIAKKLFGDVIRINQIKGNEDRVLLGVFSEYMREDKENREFKISSRHIFKK